VVDWRIRFAALQLPGNYRTVCAGVKRQHCPRKYEYVACDFLIHITQAPGVDGDSGAVDRMNVFEAAAHLVS